MKQAMLYFLYKRSCIYGFQNYDYMLHWFKNILNIFTILKLELKISTIQSALRNTGDYKNKAQVSNWPKPNNHKTPYSF